jgi:hypothetical protein
VILDPGNTLTIDIEFSSPIPFPPTMECCIYDTDFQNIYVLNSHHAPIGFVQRPWDGGVVLTNPDGNVSGVTAYFVSPALFYGPSPLQGVQLQGDYEFGFTRLPEPGSWSLAILGVGFVGAALRRRRAVSLTCA